MYSPRAVIQLEVAKLAGLQSTSTEATGPVGYLLGAAYALLRASELKHRATRIRDDTYANTLRQISRRLQRNPSALNTSRASRPWLARFYFNSALHRIAAAAARLGIHPEGRFKNRESASLARVRKDVNKLKHGRGVLRGRK